MTEIAVGTIVETKHGPALCSGANPNFVQYHYPAIRNDGMSIWVGNGVSIEHCSYTLGPFDLDKALAQKLSGRNYADADEQDLLRFHMNLAVEYDRPRRAGPKRWSVFGKTIDDSVRNLWVRYPNGHVELRRLMWIENEPFVEINHNGLFITVPMDHLEIGFDSTMEFSHSLRTTIKEMKNVHSL